MVPNKVKNSVFMSIFYGQPIREITQPNFAIGGKIRIFQIDLPLRKDLNLSLQKKFVKLLPLVEENLRYTL